MKYKVIKTFKGSPDGMRVFDYTEGEIHEESGDFPQSLIDVALTEKWIKKVVTRRTTKK